VRIQGRTDLFFLHGLLQLRLRFHVLLPALNYLVE
jgi:hypothetical protein